MYIYVCVCVCVFLGLNWDVESLNFLFLTTVKALLKMTTNGD